VWPAISGRGNERRGNARCSPPLNQSRFQDCAGSQGIAKHDRRGLTLEKGRYTETLRYGRCRCLVAPVKAAWEMRIGVDLAIDPCRMGSLARSTTSSTQLQYPTPGHPEPMWVRAIPMRFLVVRCLDRISRATRACPDRGLELGTWNLVRSSHLLHLHVQSPVSCPHFPVSNDN
jgi:hypothetical protein